jgi:hypothetical protein
MGGKVIGIITWKARAGEKLNFAAPSKLVAPLLASSGVQPLVSVPKPAAPSTGKKESVWTSITSGRDYRVRVDGNYIYTEWILPSQLQATAAFMRSVKRDDEKLVGKVRSNLPYTFKSSYADFWRTSQQMGTHNVNWCVMELQFEIDKISDSRIEGRAIHSKSFDAKKCKPGPMALQTFVWIPK